MIIIRILILCLLLVACTPNTYKENRALVDKQPAIYTIDAYYVQSDIGRHLSDLFIEAGYKVHMKDGDIIFTRPDVELKHKTK